MVQARFGHDTVMEVVEVNRSQKFHVIRGRRIGVVRCQIPHAGRPEIVAFGRVVVRVDREIARMEISTRWFALKNNNNGQLSG